MTFFPIKKVSTTLSKVSNQLISLSSLYTCQFIWNHCLHVNKFIFNSSDSFSYTDEEFESDDSFDRDSNETGSESSHSDLSDLELDFSFMLQSTCGEQQAEDNEELSREEETKAKLAEWATKNRIPRTHVTSLLHIVHDFMPFLPLDSRTLLKTLRNVITKEVHPGKYYHFGILNGLQSHLDALRLTNLPEELKIFGSLDGLPLAKSTSHQFWPIQAYLVCSPVAYYFLT